MRYLSVSALVILAVVSTIPFVLSYESDTGNLNQPLGDFTVPNWIKNNAGWWADDLIDDDSFVSGLQWMISNDIIVLPSTDQGASDGENIIPRWIKSPAGWWASDDINDITFVGAIKYLINEGVIIIEQEVEEVDESTDDIVELKEFDIVINNMSCTYCTNWAHVGEKYYFQIETFDEYRGSPIDGVTITVKFISQDGELRHDFGTITTEDGIYNNSITIPNMDWYAGNILSVTAEHNGFEKTVEKEFQVFSSTKGGSGKMAVHMGSAGSCADVSPVSVAAQNAKPQGIEFSNDGKKMYITGSPGLSDSVQYYELDGPYCIATASFVNSVSVESTDNTPTGIEFNLTGTKMYVVGKGGDSVYEYDVQTPFILNGTAMGDKSTLTDSFSLSSQETSPEDIHFNSNGKKMFIVGTQNDEVHQYSLSTPFRVSSASHDFSLSINAQENGPAGIEFNPTGTKMFIVGSGGKEVNEYTMAVRFTLSTATHTHAFSISSQESNPRGIAFDNSGKKMFIIGFSGDDVNVYKLSTPFVLSSASFVP